MIGTKLGPYQIIEEIGRGGMATVYCAYQPSVGRNVALKTLQKSISGDEQAVLRFQREARLVARLEHPHILPVYDFDGACDPPYIVMRFLNSGTLKEVLARQAIPVAEAMHLLRQIAAALDYAHRQGVVHRDIKPSNILVDQEGNAFVADFGIARLAGGPTGLTATGAMIGTPDYMAPEQVSGEGTVDHRGDIYSLGVMAYQMLAGRLPFTAETPIAVLMKHLNQPPPDITHDNPNLPPAAAEVFKRVLAKSSAERYPTAEAFFEALLAAVGGAIAPARLQPAAAAGQAGDGSPRPATGSSQLTPGEQNRPVTVLYVDASEYDELVEAQHGNETARQALTTFWQIADSVIRQRGGVVMERSERSLLALWGIESVAENDAEQAVFTALALQEALARQAGQYLGQPEAPEDGALPLCLGVNSGIVLLVRDRTSGSTSASGSTISLAQRMAQHAPGQVVIGRETFRAVQGVFHISPGETLWVRGRREAVEIFQVTGAKERAFRVQNRGVEGVNVRLVGREAELKMLQDAYLDAVEESETGTVMIVGEAGVGKTRLLSEFDQWAELRPEKYRIFRGRANPAMTRRGYALLHDIMSYRFAILENDTPAELQSKLEKGVEELIGEPDPEMAHLIGHLCGFDLSASPFVSGLKDDPRQLSSRARQLTLRLFEKVSRLRPVVIQVEDLHHADDASLDFLYQLPLELPKLRLVMVLLARPAMLERRPYWANGQENYRLIDLSPLNRRASRELVGEILKKAGEVPRELRDLLVERGEGNPFYIEELVKMLIEDRVIVKESLNVWRIEPSRVGNLNVPPTLLGVLQARFDSLVYPEKVALQRASVVGRTFYDRVVAALDGTGDELRLQADLAGILANLEHREFIQKRPDSAFAGSVEYIFSQSMQRDQIYETLLARQRATYHAGIASWIVTFAGERIGEYRALIAEHYEKAGEREKAAVHLFHAGRAALDLGAVADARCLLERALPLLPPENRDERLAASLALGECMHTVGDYSDALKLLEQTLSEARAWKRPGEQARALFTLSQICVRRGDWATALQHLAQALPQAEQAGDQEARAWVLYGLADAHYRRGELEAARAAAEAALELARQIGNGAIERNAMNRLGTILTSANPSGSPERQLSTELLQGAYQKSLAAGDRLVGMAAMVNLTLNVEDPDDESIFRYTHAALDLAREINAPVGIIVSALNLTEGYIRLGDLEQARKLLREATETARRIESETWLVACALNIGYLHVARGDLTGGLALVGAVISHPAAGHDIHLQLRSNLTHLVGAQLDEVAVEAALKAGAGQDIHAAIARFLAEA